MRFKTKIAIVVFSSLIAFYAIVGSFMSKSSQVVARGSQYGQISIFDEVLSHIIRDYVEQPDLEKVRIGILRGLAEGLDPYSAYLTPEQVKQYDPKASRAETGMILLKVGGYAYVVAVLKGSPADQLGIRAGDFIEYVGKVPSRDLSLYDVEQLVNGQAGTITDGIGAIPLNHSVLNTAFEDRITPNGTAVPIFKDDGSPAATPPVPPQPDGLSFSGTYKVVFIAFPMEAYGTADDKADLVSRVKAFFGA